MISPADIWFYIVIALRRLPLALPLAAIITGAGLLYVMSLPAVYTATATVAVEEEQIPEILAQSTVGVSATQQIQTIQQRLMTRERLLDIAEQFDVFASERGLSASDRVAAMRERIGFQVVNRTRRREEGLITFTVGFDAPDPRLSAAVTNEILNIVLSENAELRRGIVGSTLEFFQNEVDRLGLLLDEVTVDITVFKTSNQDALPDSLEYRRTEQSRIQERLLQLEREETLQRNERTRLVALAERTGGEVGLTATLSPEEEELRSLRNELQRQKVVLSATNPKVVLLEARIAALEDVVSQQRVTLGENDEVVALSDLDIRLEELDGRIAFLEEEQVRLEGTLTGIEESIRATPQNELRLSALERQRANLQGQYDAALGSLSAAATGERIELLSKGERFSVIEQAAPPGAPSSPDRKKLGLLAIAAGIAAGGGLIVLLEFLNRSIRRPVEIRRALQIEPFATIPYVRTPGERQVRRMAFSGAAVAGVVAIGGALWAVHTYYIPLDLLVEQMTSQLGVSAPSALF